MENGKTNWKSHLVFTLRAIILVKILLVAEPVFAQGRLSAIRNEVRQPKEEPKEERKRPESSHRDRDHDDHDHHDHGRRRRRRNRFHGVNFFDCSPPTQVIHTREIHIVEPAPLAPTPIIGAPVQPPSNYQSVVVPDSAPVLEDTVYEEVFEPSFQTWGARITGWYGGGIDGISQGNLGMLFQAPGSIGLDTSVRTVREQGFSDHLWMGDVNLVIEPICQDYFRMRVGIGVNWLADSWGSDAGFNLTTGFDAQLTERVILGGELDLGNLGHSDFLHAQINLGYQLDGIELVVGYDHTNIGSVDLNSPFVGMRFRY